MPANYIICYFLHFLQPVYFRLLIIDDINISKFDGGNDGSVYNGKILLSLVELSQLRFALSTDGRGSMVSSQFMGIGAPTGEKGFLAATFIDKAEITEGTAIPLLFVGYMGNENNDDGYFDGLFGISKERAAAYEFCYRVMVIFESEMP